MIITKEGTEMQMLPTGRWRQRSIGRWVENPDGSLEKFPEGQWEFAALSRRKKPANGCLDLLE